ncbi:hypothetical protein [Nocardia higoensis]|uniref:hypothetical protein n=1 Tax=Nocardia higoensis TaxID=228599 RepID=UPI0003006DC6|nr:hypothetical protein [Nocardia higoensis]
MSDDDQLIMDLGVPVERTPWGKWVDADRRAAQVRKFLEYAGISELPLEPWPEDASEVKLLNAVVASLFPDMTTAMAPESSDMADAFICLIGECFIRWAGATWIDYDWFGRDHSFYDHVNPALRFDTADEDEITAWYLMDSMIGYDHERYEGMFSEISATIRDYARYREEERNGVDAE